MKKDQEKEVQSIQDFQWDDTESFFGIAPEKNEMEEVIKKVKADDESDTPIVADEDKEPESESVGFFDIEVEEGSEKPTKTSKKSTTKEEDDDDDEDEEFTNNNSNEVGDEEGDENEDSKFYTTLASELKERDVFQNIELEEGEEIDEEKFFELQEKEVEARVQEAFEGFAESLDEDAKAFIQFKKNGGSTQDFFKVYGDAGSINLEAIDISEDEGQDAIIKLYAKSYEGLDEDEISDKIDWLEENGKKEAYAKRYASKLKEEDAKRKELLMEQHTLAMKEREKATTKFQNNLEKELQQVEEVGSFKFNKTDKKELFSYITKPSVKVGKNKYVTQFQSDLSDTFKAEGEESRQKLLLLAKLLKSNFDVKDLVESTKTKVVREAKSKLQQAKLGVKPSSSGRSTKKSMADYF